MPQDNELHVFGNRPASGRLVLGALERLGSRGWKSVVLTMTAGTAVLMGLGGVGYVATDVIGQPDQATIAQVVETKHTPSYTTITYVSDSKGNMSPRSNFVPETFQATIKIPEREDTEVVLVSEETYVALVESANTGAAYEATFRRGKWSNRVRMVDLKEPLSKVDTAPHRKRPGMS